MNQDILEKVMTFAENIDHYLIATVDQKGQPHIAAAGELALAGKDSVGITDWFCATTITNLRANPRVSVVIWDRVKDLGYQLLGEAEKVEDVAMMDGYSPQLDKNAPLPQVEHRLIVRINMIFDFSLRGQSDREE